LFALAATSFGALLDPLPLRDQEYFGRVIRAWATLVIGLSFFVAAAWMNRNEEQLRFSVKWLLAGFLMDVVWSGVQALAFYTPLIKKVSVTHWQRAFSMRELVKTNRISGMAYEPAWFAGQIATIYVPWLLASLLTRVKATRFKGLEVLLSGLALLLLLATYSRGGLLATAFALVVTLFFAGRKEMLAFGKWFLSGFQRGGNWLLRLGILLVMFSALMGALWFLGQKGYIARIFNSRADNLQEFIVQNSAGARTAQSFGALAAYRQSPIFGVGLGASGFYILDNLPDWTMTTVPEVARLVSPNNRLYPNAKNLYVRLLAETGLIGFFMFLAFLFSILGDALLALQSRRALLRYLGIAGLFSWLAIAVYNVTQDSFATPNIWINFGILAGMTAHALASETAKPLQESPP
jgi:O-antigen ligase